jgi:hypothetical protein
MLYRDDDKLVGAEILVRALDVAELTRQLIPHAVSRAPIAWNVGPPNNAQRACITRTLSEAIADAAPWISGSKGLICADTGRTRVSWTFFQSDQSGSTSGTRKYGFQLVIRDSHVKMIGF